MTILMCLITVCTVYAQGWFAPFSKQEINSFHQDVKKGRLSKELQNALQRTALINSTDKDGNTPLMMATYKGNAKMVALLLENGAQKSINWRNYHGMTALCIAAQMKRVKTVALLLSKGADPNLKCGFGDDAASPLYLAAYYGAVPQIIQALVAQGADVNFAKKNGDTPLIKVAQRGGVDAARILVKAGADIHAEVKYVGDGAKTATGIAKNHANWEVFRFLLKRGGVTK